MESHPASVYKEVAVGHKKGMKKYINRFVEEADDLLMQIGNETFYSLSKEYKEERND